MLIAGDNTLYKIVAKKKSDGSAKDLTGATVQLRLSINGATASLKTMTVTSASDGEAQYRFLTGDLTPGKARIEIVVTDGSGNVETSDPPLIEEVRDKVGG